MNIRGWADLHREIVKSEGKIKNEFNEFEKHKKGQVFGVSRVRGKVIRE